MIPRLVLGPVDLPTHDVFVVLGALAGALVFGIVSRRRGEWNAQHALVAAGALLCGAAFAKASTAWRYAVADDAPTALGVLAFGGKSILGGLAGAYAGALATKRLVGVRTSTGDLFAPAVPVALAIGRIGCFLTERPGTPTALPWGVHLSPAAAAQMPDCAWCATAAMHPSFLYEIAFQVLAVAVVVACRDRIPVRGELFKWYLLAYGIFRFAIEEVRGNPDLLGGLSGSQVFLLATVPLLATFLGRRWRSGMYRPPLLAAAEATA